MGESSRPGLFGRLAEDYHSTRTYVKANAQSRRVNSQRHAAEAELSGAYHQLGAKAWESGGAGAADLPAAGPVRDAQQAIKQAEAALTDRQSAVAAAEATLASQTTRYDELISKLQAEHAPLAESAAQSAKDRAAAGHELAGIEGEIGKAQAELARLNAGGASTDDLETLQRRLAQLQESRTAASSRLAAATASQKQAIDAAKAKAAEIKAADKAFQSFQSQCKSELKAAQAAQAAPAPTTGSEAAVKAVNDKLAAREKEHNQTIALLQGHERQQAEAVKAAGAELDAARNQLAQIDAEIGQVNNHLAARHVERKLAELDKARQSAGARLAEAKSRDVQAASAASAKAGELDKARQEWKDVKAKCEADLSAGRAAQVEAERAVESARGPLAEALRALGQAVVRAGLTQPALADGIAQAQAILANIAGFDKELSELHAQADAARGGTKRFAIVAAAALVVLIAIIVGACLITHRIRSGKWSSNFPPGPNPTPAVAAAWVNDTAPAVCHAHDGRFVVGM